VKHSRIGIGALAIEPEIVAVNYEERWHNGSSKYQVKSLQYLPQT
jgi:hypothetical protein